MNVINVHGEKVKIKNSWRNSNEFKKTDVDDKVKINSVVFY